jgi:sortase (surface protein transpeptidase)
VSALTLGRRSVAALGPILVLALLVSGCAGTGGSEAAAPAAAVSDDGDNPLSAGRMQDPRIGGGAGAAASAGTPTGIRIPSIGVDSALENLGVGTDGRLNAPVDYDLAGWYSAGVVPGAVGPAIIAGHVDSPTAPAVFAHVAELERGDDVIVRMSDGSEKTFRVTRSIQSDKSDFPSAAVYSNVPAPELRLITCSGEFDSEAGHYRGNLIVFAELVP